jgi:hypothetical protein
MAQRDDPVCRRAVISRFYLLDRLMCASDRLSRLIARAGGYCVTTTMQR